MPTLSDSQAILAKELRAQQLLIFWGGLLLHIFLLSFIGMLPHGSWQLRFARIALPLGTATGVAFCIYLLHWRPARGPVATALVALLPLPLYLPTAACYPMRSVLAVCIAALQWLGLQRGASLAEHRHLERLHARHNPQAAPVDYEPELEFAQDCHLAYTFGLLLMQLYHGGQSYAVPLTRTGAAHRALYALFLLAGGILIALVTIGLRHRRLRLPWSLWAAAALLPAAVWLFATGGPWLPVLLLHSVLLDLFFHHSRRKASRLTEWFLSHPAQLLAVSFMLLIAIGAHLLSLPFCDASGEGGLPLPDALFTATSAVCVTGLTVVDTGSRLTFAGQAVLAGLVQLGSIGIMTVSAFIAVAVGYQMGLLESRAVANFTGEEKSLFAKRIIRHVILLTLSIEAVGALLFWLYLSLRQPALPNPVWRSFFMSLNTFCNSGFALDPDSFLRWRREPVPLAIGTVLILLGGLGFSVLTGAWKRLTQRQPHHLPPHLKVIFWTTAILTISGALLFLLWERHASLQGLTPAQQIANACFMAASGRTAGMNSVDLGAMRPCTLLLLRTLMFIGGAPGSTGGGIRVTTFAILAMLVWALVRGRPRVVVFKTTVPERNLHQASAVLLLAVALVTLATTLLAALLPAESLMTISFECTSAFSTNGLSLGLSPRLPLAGKLLFVLAMFVGRIGLLTVLDSMRLEPATPQLRYPIGRIPVG